MTIAKTRHDIYEIRNLKTNYIFDEFKELIFKNAIVFSQIF